MPVKLSTTLQNISTLQNQKNALLIKGFYKYFGSIGTSENYQNQNLKALINYAKFLGPSIDFYKIKKKDEVISFLDTKIKDSGIDLDKKWIRTWNDYLQRLKYFFRWLYNEKERKDKDLDTILPSDWLTAGFVKIIEKRTNRISPLSGNRNLGKR
jgi:integrase/recombinase XerD